MTSANGKIPAGTTFVNVTELGMIAEREETSAPLTKCPDRAAQLTFNKKVEFIRTIRKVEYETRNQKVRNLLMRSKNLRNTSGHKRDISGKRKST